MLLYQYTFRWRLEKLSEQFIEIIKSNPNDELSRRLLIYLYYWHECIKKYILNHVLCFMLYHWKFILQMIIACTIVLVINFKLHEHEFYVMHNYNFSLWHSSYFATCLINVKSILCHRDRCATFDPNSGLWYIYISIFYFIAFQSWLEKAIRCVTY